MLTPFGPTAGGGGLYRKFSNKILMQSRENAVSIVQLVLVLAHSHPLRVNLSREKLSILILQVPDSLI